MKSETMQQRDWGIPAEVLGITRHGGMGCDQMVGIIGKTLGLGTVLLLL